MGVLATWSIRLRNTTIEVRDHLYLLANFVAKKLTAVMASSAFILPSAPIFASSSVSFETYFLSHIVNCEGRRDSINRKVV